MTGFSRKALEAGAEVRKEKAETHDRNQKNPGRKF